MKRTLTSPKTTAQTNNRLANITIAPPNIPTRNLLDPIEKHGAI